MEESTTYQWIMAQGAVRELRKVLLRQGARRFGPPDRPATDSINTIEELGRLEALSERILEVNSWQELLETP